MKTLSQRMLGGDFYLSTVVMNSKAEDVSLLTANYSCLESLRLGPYL